ncbi:hypothetical protein EYF80_007586 [Liparis tanakae]|uniref:Uncharacterized protein n=1 Tax=Liparis tanakae TaxID=230148 RepID=A0A4Z2IXJ2_9TELE|nr:hypothetical protein EYF80_007586 [Liparis tanakae]
MEPVSHWDREEQASPLVLRLTVTPSDLWVSVAGVDTLGFLLPAYTLTTQRYTPESRGWAENSFRENLPSDTFSIEPPLARLRSSPQLTTPSGLIWATCTLITTHAFPQMSQQKQDQYLDSVAPGSIAAPRSPLHPLNQQARGHLRRQPQHLTGQDERGAHLQGHLPLRRGRDAQRLGWGTEEVEGDS